MTTDHYQPRPMDAAWLAHVNAVVAAARLALHDEECGCQAMAFNEHRQYEDLNRAVADTDFVAWAYDPPIRLSRNGVEIARWRCIA